MSKKVLKANDVLDSLAASFKNEEIVATKLLAKISVTITSKRIELEMNQKQFADYMGVTQGMISKWENGNCNFTIETLASICDKLKLELDIKMNDVKNEYLNTFDEIKSYGYSNIISASWEGVA